MVLAVSAAQIHAGAGAPSSRAASTPGSGPGVHGRKVSGPVPQQRIAAAAVIARFAHQQVEREAPQIVGHRIDVRVFLLVEDLAVGMTLVASLGADGPGVALDRVVGDVRGALSLYAADVNQVLLCGTSLAVQIP